MNTQLLDTLSPESVYMPTQAQIIAMRDLTAQEKLFT